MKQYSYMIQIGMWPHSISFACVSAPEYKTSDDAEMAAFDYLVSRGYDPNKISTKWIHTRSHRLPQRAQREVSAKSPYPYFYRLKRALEIMGKARDRARDSMPVTMCGNHKHKFCILTTREVN